MREYRYRHYYLVPQVGHAFTQMIPADPTRFLLVISTRGCDSPEVRPQGTQEVRRDGGIPAEGVGIILTDGNRVHFTFQDFGQVIGYPWEFTSGSSAGQWYVMEGCCG